METTLGRNRLAALLKAHHRLCKICKKSLHKSHASAKVHRRCSAAYQRQKRKRETLVALVKALNEELVSGRALRGNIKDAPTDSSVASGAVDEGSPGTPTANAHSDVVIHASDEVFRVGVA